MNKLLYVVSFLLFSHFAIAQCDLELKYDAAGNRIFRGNKCNPDCSVHVTNTEDIGNGSLREAVYCANNGDNITFENSLANQAIKISGKIVVDRSIDINKTAANYTSVDIIVKSVVDDLVLEVDANHEVFLNNLNLISNAGYNANPRILNNNGILTLKNMTLSDDAEFRGENSTISNSGSLTLLDILNHIYIFYQ